MPIYVSTRSVRRAAPIATGALLAILTFAQGMPARAEQSPKDSFAAIQRQVESIEPRLVKSTVLIRLYDGSGSGVIISPDGLVLTAGHVVEGRQGRHITAVLADGRTVPASVVAYDQESDLGIVRITGVEGLTAAPIGDSATLRRGEWVLATGHPLGPHAGRPPVLRIGRVLFLRGARFGRETRSISTDAPIISGDSGGPLFDLTGRVVGINSMITTGERRMASIHVAVNLAKAAIARIAHGETPDSWDGPPEAFANDLREGRSALQAGDGATAVRFAREAGEVDPSSAYSRLLLAHAEVKTGQPQLALSAISQACDRGFNDAEAIRKDPDFGPLTTEPALARILDRLDTLNGIPGDRKSDVSMFAAGAPGDLTQGVVRVRAGGADVTLGTVMSPDGDIVTKASELPEGPLTTVLPDGQTAPVMRKGVDSAWDVALLRVNVSGLKALPLADTANVGEWTFSPDAQGGLAAVGIVGVLEMPVHGRGIATKATSKGYMGIQMESAPEETLKAAGLKNGVRVGLVQHGLPAERAGIQVDDILFEAEGAPIGDADTFMDLLVNKKPGDAVTVRLLRGSERITVSVTLTARPAGILGRNGLPEMLSGEISRMQGPFDHVLHHDSVLKPNAMGGPLLDSQGRCIGVNIARADRTSTYAIPARDIRDIYARLKAAR